MSNEEISVRQRQTGARALVVLGLCIVTAVVAVVIFVLSSRGPATYDSLDDLHHAYIEAGGTCETWDKYDVSGDTEYPRHGGYCGGSDVFMGIVDARDSEAFDMIKSGELLAEASSIALVGPNWVVGAATDIIDEVQPELGGDRYGQKGAE